MKHQKTSLIVAAACLLALGSATNSSFAQTIAEDFESSSAGSGTPPAGWSLITAAGTPSYATSAAGAGSDGSGGSSGLAGEVSSTTFLDAFLAGGYLVSDTAFDLNSAVSGTFDFRIVNEGSFDDVTFMIGDIADGYDDTGNSGVGTPGELLNVKWTEVGATNYSALTNGYGRDFSGGDRVGELDTDGTDLTDDTWYRVTVTWTPTSGLTGDFSVTVNDFTSDVLTLSTTDFTFDSADGYIGFGSVNDTIRLDNIDFTAAAAGIPNIIDLAVDGSGNVVLTLDGPAAGLTVEQSDNLTGGSFQDVNSAVASGSTFTIPAADVDPNGDGKDFFRVSN